MKKLNIVKYTIKTVCVLLAFVLVGVWLYRYNLDEDFSVVEGKSYFDDPDDVYPVMSICFKQTFENFHLKSHSTNLSALDYRNFLIGERYHPSMKKIDYHGVSTNISDFTLEYDIEFRNGTYLVGASTPIGSKPLYYTASWISWGRNIVKCFGLEIIDKDVYYIRLYVKREIFPNMTRDSNGGFAVLFHYPNQFSASFKTLRRQWPNRDASSNHYMSFNLKGMYVNIQRYKKNQRNCIEDWKNFDKIILQKHLQKVGCKTPDQITNGTWPICSSGEKMKTARLRLNSLKLRPCREIISIDYDMGESDDNIDYAPIVNGKRWNNWISFVYRILNPHFTVTRQRKDVDIQTLIGYIGGYIGIFTGFALAQIPDYLYSAIIYAKMWILNSKEKKKNHTVYM